MMVRSRTSTLDQVAGFEAQICNFKKQCAKVMSRTSFICWNAPSTRSRSGFHSGGRQFSGDEIGLPCSFGWDLMVQLAFIEEKKAGFRILNLGIDTQTPTGKLMLTVLGGIAQFEREIMQERQHKGVTRAKADGKYKGRKPIDPLKRSEACRLDSQGDCRALGNWRSNGL